MTDNDRNNRGSTMNAPQQVPNQADIEQQMQATLDTQREAYLKEGVVSAETRIDRIQRGVDVLIKYNEKIADALNTDFTCRPREVTLLTDVGAGIAPLKHAIKHVRSWMKPQKRPTMFPFNLLGGRSRIEYQPLGVVLLPSRSVHEGRYGDTGDGTVGTDRLAGVDQPLDLFQANAVH